MRNGWKTGAERKWTQVSTLWSGFESRTNKTTNSQNEKPKENETKPIASNTISRTLVCGFPHLNEISLHKIQFSIIFFSLFSTVVFFACSSFFAVRWLLLLLKFYSLSLSFHLVDVLMMVLCVAARAEVSQLQWRAWLYERIPYETANLYVSCSLSLAQYCFTVVLPHFPSSTLEKMRKKIAVHFSGITYFVCILCQREKKNDFKFVEHKFFSVWFQYGICKRLSNHSLSCGQWANKEPHSTHGNYIILISFSLHFAAPQELSFDSI